MKTVNMDDLNTDDSDKIPDEIPNEIQNAAHAVDSTAVKVETAAAGASGNSERDPELCWIWLSSLTEVNINSRAALLEVFGTAEEALKSEPGSFFGVEGVPARDAEILEKRDLSEAKKIRKRCAKENIRILTIDDPAYPERLKNIYAPPYVLYVRGELPEIDSMPLVAFVGTREASPYGLKMSRKIAAEFTECGGTVVSGLTRGIDSAAAEGALDAGGKVIGFLGVSITAATGPLEERVAKNGALISEYAPGTAGQKHFFRERNRIGAGISVAVAAIESPRHSGTVLFVREALEQGKQIFSVPGNADSELSEGTLQFIKDGAQLITNGGEIALELECSFPESFRKNKKTIDSECSGCYIDELKTVLTGLTEIQQTIVTAVAGGCGTVEEISAETGLPAHKLLAEVTMLEVKNVLTRDFSRRIVIKK